MITKPIYLFADSQLLFWSEDDVLFLKSVRDHLGEGDLKAAYVGASNGDDPQFFSIFEAAMQNIGVVDLRMIESSFSAEDAAFMDSADIILLSGGDVEKGWNVFTSTGLAQSIVKRHEEGAVLIGVSAGAVQLGMMGWADEVQGSTDFFYTLRLVPFIISAHDEGHDWEKLKGAVTFAGNNVSGI